MTKLEYDTKINREGRMVIPAEVRKALNLLPGDRVRLILDESGVHLVSARSLAVGLWANNTGGDAGESVADIREFRTNDRIRSDSKFEKHAQSDPRSEDEITSNLMSSLGLND